MEQELKENGFFITPVLESSEIQNAIDLVQAIPFKQKREGFKNIVHLDSYNDRKAIHRAIVNLLYPRIEALFSGYVPFIGSFAIKYQSETNNVPLHLDWSVLDEQVATSYNIWIPLQDVHEQNGCMGLLEKSHRFKPTIRGSLINHIATTEYCDQPILACMLKTYQNQTLPMKAGEALIYNHRMAHYSHPNFQEEPRLAISMVIVPRGTSPIHYHFEKDQSVSIFKSNTEFYLTYDMKSYPGDYLQKIGSIPGCDFGSLENQLDPLIYVGL